MDDENEDFEYIKGDESHEMIDAHVHLVPDGIVKLHHGNQPYSVGYWPDPSGDCAALLHVHDD